MTCCEDEADVVGDISVEVDVWLGGFDAETLPYSEIVG